MIGVYKISNIIDNRIYIGSSVSIKKRWSEHKRDLINNTHHNLHLQRFVNKYGVDSLKFEIIEECEPSNYLNREQFYLNNNTNLFNISSNSSAPMLGKKHSEETKRKISRPGKLNPMYGVIRSDKTRKNIAEKNRGRVKTKSEINKRIKNLPNRKPVYAVNNYILIEEESMSDMARTLKVSIQSISKSLKNRTLCKGFKIYSQPQMFNAL